MNKFRKQIQGYKVSVESPQGGLPSAKFAVKSPEKPKIIQRKSVREVTYTQPQRNSMKTVLAPSDSPSLLKESEIYKRKIIDTSSSKANQSFAS